MEQLVPGVYLEYTPPQCPSVPLYTYTLDLNFGHLSHTFDEHLRFDFFTYLESVLPTGTPFALGFPKLVLLLVVSCGIFSLALFVFLFPHVCE